VLPLRLKDASPSGPPSPDRAQKKLIVQQPVWLAGKGPCQARAGAVPVGQVPVHVAGGEVDLEDWRWNSRAGATGSSPVS
jgi:hypothetical protein